MDIRLINNQVKESKIFRFSDYPELKTFSELFGQNIPEINEAIPSLNDITLQITGKSSFFNLKEHFDITFTIIVDEKNNLQKVEFKNTENIPDTWKITDIFANLPNSWNKSPDNSLLDYSNSIFSSMSLKEQNFVVTSGDSSAKVEPGIYYSGKMDISIDGFEFFPKLFPTSLQKILPVTGTIDLSNPMMPEITLKAEIVDQLLQFQHIKLDNLYIKYKTINGLGFTENKSARSLGGNFVSTKNPDIKFEIEAFISENENWVFEVDLPVGEVTLKTGIDALNDLLNFSFDFTIPDNISILSDISLKSFTVGINPFEKTFTHIGGELYLSESWNVIKDVLEINDISLSVFSLFPFNQGSSPKVIILSGILSLGENNDTEIKITAEYAAKIFSITGQLEPGDEIDLGDAVSSFTKIDGLPNLKITNLTVEADSTGNFIIDSVIEEDWNIPVAGDIVFEIEKTQFSLSYPSGKPGQTFDWFFSGLFAISDFNFIISVNKNAANNGFDIHARSTNADVIHICKFLDYLTEKFKLSLPDFIADISLTNISVDFNTYNTNISFECVGLIPVDGMDIQIDFSLSLEDNTDPATKDKKKVKDDLKVTIVIDDNTFIVEGIIEDDFITLKALYNGDALEVNLQSLIRKISTDIAETIPEDLNITLVDAFVFARRRKSEKKYKTILGFISEFSPSLSMSGLPLVGDKLPSSLGIDKIQAIIASTEFASADLGNDILSHLINQGNSLSVDKKTCPDINKGLNLSVNVTLGDSTSLVISMPVNKNQDQYDQQQKDRMAAQQVTGSYSQDGVWFKIEKTFGPVELSSIGFQWKSPKIIVLLNVFFHIGVMKLGLVGLSGSFELKKGTNIEFSLSGLSLFYDQPPLEIGGGFSRVADNQFSGFVMIDTPTILLSAMGFYGKSSKTHSLVRSLANGNDYTSLFIFGVFNQPIGGPPAFFIEALAGGFGFNSSLNIPSVENLNNFLLIQAVLPDNQSGLSNDMPPTQVLDKLQANQNISPAFGLQWLTAGLRASSFEMIKTVALIVVRFGAGLQFDIIGLIRISLPKDEQFDPIAFIEIGFDAVVSDKGFFLDSRLTTNSFIISSDAILTGGFSWYIWFQDHPGDFVITMGGYSPKFSKPDHYPSVPRLTFNWNLSGEATMKGDAYLALTPHCIMAGGALDFTWEAGPIKAWFSSEMDLFLSWKPFHYELEMDVSVGVEATIDLLFTSVTIGVSIDVGLSIFGPEFGGKAHIDLSIISFSISFGSSNNPGYKSITWEQFKTSFLFPAAGSKMLTAPNDDNNNKKVCNLKVSEGLIKEINPNELKPGEKTNWLLHHSHITIQADLVIPLKKVTLNNIEQNSSNSKISDFNDNFSAGPLGPSVKNFSPELVIEIKKEDDDGKDYSFYSSDYTVMPLLKNMPKSLWIYEDPANIKINGSQFLENALAGIQIVSQPNILHPTEPVPVENLLYEKLSSEKTFSLPKLNIPQSDNFNEKSDLQSGTLSFTINGQKPERVISSKNILSPVTNAQTTIRRNNILTTMNDLGFKLNQKIKLDNTGSNTILLDWPVISNLGEEKACNNGEAIAV